HGVAAKLYAKGITDYDLSVILPTGWNRTIQTVTLTGQQINDLLATGYDAYGNGKGYPYVMASPVQPEADKTYQVAICGVSDQLAAEADVVDSGVVGMDAAKAFFGAYTSISRADTAWS
ncbi:MAG: ABC transporter substrate-binding protein, partial [Faecalibacterium sp.]